MILEKFMFDVVPYYVYPFWKPDATEFLKEMNPTLADAYDSQNKMKFNPSDGVSNLL